MARGCVSGVNSGPRFVTHEDRRARNNWRDPTERLGGPACNAGRILLNRRSACFASTASKQSWAKEARGSSDTACRTYRRRRWRAAVETCIVLMATTALGGSMFGSEGGPWREKAKKTRRRSQKRAPIGWRGGPLHLMPTSTCSSVFLAAEEIGQTAGDSRAQCCTNARKSSWRRARPATTTTMLQGGAVNLRKDRVFCPLTQACIPKVLLHTHRFKLLAAR
jgi:hypothetical protein